MKKQKWTEVIIVAVILAVMCGLMTGCSVSGATVTTTQEITAEEVARRQAALNELNDLNKSLATSVEFADYGAATGAVSYTVNGITLTYPAYKSYKEASEYEFVLYADDSCFPIEVCVKSFRNSALRSQSMTSYGTTCVRDNWAGDIYCYSMITVKPFFPTEEETEQVSEVSADQTTMDEKVEMLLGELDLAPIEGLEDMCHQDLRDFLLGEWDGTARDATIDNSRVVRAGYARTYTCSVTDPATDEVTATTINIDYIGELQRLANVYDEHEFTLVTNGANLIEQWSLLEQQDGWQVPLDATVTEVNVIELLEEDGFEDQIAIVMVIDKDSQMRDYRLVKGGEVIEVTV